MAEHVNYIEWRIHPFRSPRWLETWSPALERALAFGAKTAFLTRNVEDRLHFRQVTVWERREDFDRYWASDEIESLREQALNYFNKPLLPVWHAMAIETGAAPAEPEPAAAEAAK